MDLVHLIEDLILSTSLWRVNSRDELDLALKGCFREFQFQGRANTFRYLNHLLAVCTKIFYKSHV